jgi:hypothetical protein
MWFSPAFGNLADARNGSECHFSMTASSLGKSGYWKKIWRPRAVRLSCPP